MLVKPVLNDSDSPVGAQNAKREAKYAIAKADKKQGLRNAQQHQHATAQEQKENGAFAVTELMISKAGEQCTEEAGNGPADLGNGIATAGNAQIFGDIDSKHVDAV